MSQFLSQIPVQVLKQEMRLTPQLIQSMDILQLSIMALENRINQELESNPVLEFEPPVEAAPDPQPREDRTRQEKSGEAESFDHLDKLSREYDFDPGDTAFFSRPRAAPADGERDAKLDAMANTIARSEGLDEYLLHQWHLVELDPEVSRAGEAIISCIEEDGYLRTRPEEIAERVKPALSMETLNEAITQVQSLDPVGVGAQDVVECLLLQLERMPGDNRIERELIENHLDDVTKNRYPAISKATGYSIGEIQEAVEVISHLSLHPGLLVVDREVPRINPDIIVDYDEYGKGLEVRLARENSPRVRIIPTYRKMFEQRSNDKEVRDYVRKHLESAHALIDAIKYRRERLVEVARAVVKRQSEFFEQGPQALKVLRMSELAERFGCDPSTISRTVADKYMQTPRGIFPVRYFFTGGTETGLGESTSWDSIKVRVKEIIDKEDRRKPLSDDQVADILRQESITISRRTIAKYRQQLSIPPARQRKAF